MLSQHEVQAAIGSSVHGPEGDRIGTVETFFADDRSGAPTWVAISTGSSDDQNRIAPALDATFVDDRLTLPVSADAVRTAPQLRGDHLEPAEEDLLREHYGLGSPSGVGTADRTGTDAGAPPARTADDGAMTRSEERLRVRTEEVASTRVRLVKYVVTEEVQLTVPVRREEVRLEEVPLDAPDTAAEGDHLVEPVEGGAAGPGTGEPTGEMVLHAERPVVQVEVVPIERVRLSSEWVAGQETVTDQVRRERITVDEDPTGR